MLFRSVSQSRYSGGEIVSDLYRIDEENKNNLMFFLNRVEFKGLKELNAINNILECLSNSIEECE